MAKCCSDITARDLRDKITVERKTRVSDGQGGYTESWAADPAGGVWARMDPLGGSERWQAMRVGSPVRYRAIVRWKDDGSGNAYWSAADRVTFQGRTYAISAVYPYQGGNRFVEMMLAESAPS